jgi:hypothetical protein
MTRKKLHFTLLFFSLITTCFIYCDTYLIPTRNTTEFVTNIREKSSYRGGDSYLLTTNRGEYVITETIYESVSVGDSIVIKRSIISGSVQKIAVRKENVIYTYFTGFARVGTGILYVPIVLICNLLLIIFYRIIRNPRAENNLTYAVFIVTMILLFFHISY